MERFKPQEMGAAATRSDLCVVLSLLTLSVEKDRHFGKVECGWLVGGVIQPRTLIANSGPTGSHTGAVNSKPQSLDLLCPCHYN
jgi:hypothetical protein